MREIKFRVWEPDIKLLSGSYELDDPGLSYCLDNYTKEKPLSLQYTGLLDKNGKEIYEGDVYLVRSKHEVVKDLNDFVYLVLYSEDHSGLGGYSRDEIEVIGNIYENPELVSEGDNHE